MSQAFRQLSTKVDYLLIKWNYPFLINIEGSKFCEKSQFLKETPWDNMPSPFLSFEGVDKYRFSPFFVKKQKKTLAKKFTFTKFVAQFRRVPLPMLSGITEVLETF